MKKSILKIGIVILIISAGLLFFNDKETYSIYRNILNPSVVTLLWVRGPHGTGRRVFLLYPADVC